MLPIEIPFRQFFDQDGRPLDGGYVYFGQPNQNPETAPITVYWDAAGTQPASQPIRTVNGYAVRSGALSGVFTAAEYSITVRNKTKEIVYYAPSSIEFDPNTSFRDLSKSSGAAMVGFQQSGVGAVARLAQDKLREVVSVKDFGAVGDGMTDDTAAIQAAINSGAMSLYVPPTQNGYRVTAPLKITSPITIYGGGTTPYGANGPYSSRGIGSWFFFDHLGIGFDIGRTTTAEFLATVTLEKIGTYRNQPAPAASWAPTDFSFDFQASNTDVIYRDLMLLNATRGINHINGEAGRVVIDNVRGQCFKTGINIDKALDSVRLDKLHIWPFWSNDSNVTAYMSNNLTAIALNRCDNPHFSNIFGIYANIVLGIYQNASGTVSKLRVVNADFDICRYAIFVDTGVSGATAQFANITSYGPNTADLNSYNIRVLGSHCRLDFANLEGQNLSRGLIQVAGSGNKVQISQARANTWARADANAPLMDNLAGNTMHINTRILTDGTGTKLINNAGDLFYPGLVTKGEASIAATGTSVVVNHGLPFQPTLGQIQIWMLTGLASAKVVWTSNITATQFTINCDVAPGVSISIGWRASLE